MSSTSISSATFPSIFDAALDSYAKQTEIDITSVDNFQSCDSSEAVLQVLQAREKEFKDYRDKNRKLINCLRPVVEVIHAFAGALSEVTCSVPLLPTKAIFVGIDVLLTAAIGVSASYDALVDLFECIRNFLQRLHIYTEIPLDSTMTHILIAIMVEILSVLALATKQIKQGRLRKFAKKLLGESEIEAILQRLDRLTQEETRMTVAQTFEVVHGLFNNLKIVMDDGKASTEGVRKALVKIQETADKMNKMERNHFQKDVRSWLSPPDPSTNHYIARRHHHDGTATWFIQSNTFKEWTATGSLLWIHGKRMPFLGFFSLATPDEELSWLLAGSGKSVLCSSIIQEVKELQDAGLALMAYFYCDFRDSTKQDVRYLVASLLVQLSAKFHPSHNILLELFSKCDDGLLQPDDRELSEYLEKILKEEGQPSIYIIVDAVDECPSVSGVVSHRDRVLDLVERLATLQLPNLRICLTSRPEADIRASLGSLASHTVSLHDQSGQQDDIADYVSFVVHSDREMRKWRAEDKKLVIETLSHSADGMFRCIACQLEMLRHCLPAAIRGALDDLPRGLDETYEQILLGISKERRIYAQRLFQCLAVSMRPLRVDELAEVLAIQFDDGTLPTYNATLRPMDSEDAVLSTCSSLISIVNVEDGSPIVQFSHFSVKEYLTSARLANAGRDLSSYHIVPREAHTVLAQASLSVLLTDHVDRSIMESCPFATYSAQNWVDHAQFENVSSSIEGVMEHLFESTKPHFATWIWIYDIDHPSREIMFETRPTRPEAVPLYYATLCGFRGLVEHLIVTRPQDVNARGGHYATPLHAALAKGNVDIALLLLKHHADVNGPNEEGRTPLHVASLKGRLNDVVLLIKHRANVNAQDQNGNTPLIMAAGVGEKGIVLVLLRHHAVVNSPDEHGWTPLMAASQNGHQNVVRLLLENGADVNSCDNDGWTSLITASRQGHPDVVNLLLQSNAAVESSDDKGSTPLMSASNNGHLQVVRLLLGKGAAVDSRNNDGMTPLVLASINGHLHIVRLLLERGGAVDSRSKGGCTPLMFASLNGYLDVARLLLENGAVVESRDDKGQTPLILASLSGRLHVVRLLLEKGAAMDCRDSNGLTPLMSASLYGHAHIVDLLLQNGAGGHEYRTSLINAGPGVLVENRSTPLHLASAKGHLGVVELLFESSADINTRDGEDKTPLDRAYETGRTEVARFLAERIGGVVTPSNARSQLSYVDEVQLPPRSEDTTHSDDGERPSLHAALEIGNLVTIRCILDRGADVNERNAEHMTPLDVASTKGDSEVAKLLLEYGARVNFRNRAGWTPLHYASRFEAVDVARLLLDHGAEVNAKNRDKQTPLHLAAHMGDLEVVKLLLERRADFHARNDDGRTPAQQASCVGEWRVVRYLSIYAEQRVLGVGLRDTSVHA